MHEEPVQGEMFGTERSSELSVNAGSGEYGYYLTNQNNLFDILSSGYIKPSDWMTKYYDDLARFCPLGIPLLLVPPSESLIAQMVNLEDNFYPVLIQVDLQGISGNGYLIDNSFEFHRVKLPDVGPGLCLVLQYSITLDHINLIYFRNYNELKETKLRFFDNVPRGLVEYQPAGDLFINSDTDFSGLLGALETVNGELESIEKSFPDALDSIAGGQLLLAKLAESFPQVPLEAVAAVLQQVLRIIQSRGKKWLDTPADFGWLSGIRHVLPESSKGFMSVRDLYVQAEKAGLRQELIVEWLLAWIAMRKLAWLEKKMFSPDQTVSDIFSEFYSQVDILNLEHVEDLKKVYSNILQLISDIRDGLQDLQVFIHTFPPSDFPVSMAVLVFSSRQSPAEVLAAHEQFQDINSSVFSMLAVFSGLLTGRTLMPVDSRPSSTQFTAYVDDLLAGVLNGEKNGIDLSPEIYPLNVDRNDSEDILVESLSVENRTLMVREIITSVPEESVIIPEKTVMPSEEPEVTHEGALLPEDQVEVQQVSEPGFTEDIEYLRKVMTSEKIIPENENVYLAAIEICRLMHWEDLVSTVILLENRDFILEYRLGKMEFRVPGFVRSRHRIRQEKEFKDRFKMLPHSKLQKLILAGIVQQLRGV